MYQNKLTAQDANMSYKVIYTGFMIRRSNYDYFHMTVNREHEKRISFEAGKTKYCQLKKNGTNLKVILIVS